MAEARVVLLVLGLDGLRHLPDGLLAHLVDQREMQITGSRHNDAHCDTLRLVPRLELIRVDGRRRINVNSSRVPSTPNHAHMISSPREVCPNLYLPLHEILFREDRDERVAGAGGVVGHIDGGCGDRGKGRGLDGWARHSWSPRPSVAHNLLGPIGL